jgi:BlaI family penicillinase repressor
METGVIDNRPRDTGGPLIARSVYVQAESQGLLDRLFEGQLAPMISHFAQHRELKSEEIARLKRLIEDLENGG